MLNRVFSAVIFVLLLANTLTLAFNIRVVNAAGTIYIRADGSIDPPTAPISTLDNVTYTLTGDITSDADGIVVERSNMIIDGAGYTVHGIGPNYSSRGIYLFNITNVTIENMTIKSFYYGVYLDSASQNVISANYITANAPGIYLNSSSDNTIRNNSMENNGNGLYLERSLNNSITGNNITASYNEGIDLMYSSNNSITGNNIISTEYGGIVLLSSSKNNITRNTITNNGCGVWFSYSSDNNVLLNNFDNTEQVCGDNSTNVWDDGYPSGGNYWSDYNGTDANHDGIGDTPYIIDANNTDRCPLMTQYIVPEFPPYLLLPLVILTTVLATMMSRKKHSRFTLG